MHLVYVTAALLLSFGEMYIVPEILEPQRRGHRVTVILIRPRRELACLFTGCQVKVCRTTSAAPLARWLAPLQTQFAATVAR
jgi:hypothetical protein